MPLMKSLKKFFKGKSCGCSATSTSTTAKRNHTRKRKRNVKRRYRGGFKYSGEKASKKTPSEKGNVVFSSNSTRRRSKKKTRTNSN